MKFHHLLVCSICVAATVSTSASLPSLKAIKVGHDEAKFLRGPEIELPVPDQNFDKADDYPSPNESEDELEFNLAVDEALENEPIADVGGDYKPDEEREIEEEIVDVESKPAGFSVGVNGELELDEEENHGFRRLRSTETFAQKINVTPSPPPETVTGPDTHKYRKLNLRVGHEL